MGELMGRKKVTGNGTGAKKRAVYDVLLWHDVPEDLAVLVSECYVEKGATMAFGVLYAGGYEVEWIKDREDNVVGIEIRRQLSLEERSRRWEGTKRQERRRGSATG